MNIFSKVIRYLTDSGYRFMINASRGKYNSMSDQEFLQKEFYAVMGKKLNLENPQTFNEKLQWLKLYDRKPVYTTMVDKYEAKKYVADIIGEEYIIPTLGVWDKYDDIDFDKLPNQFVLKCTHDSGGLVICKDKSNFDINASRAKIEKSLARNYYLVNREWPYKNVRRRIIAEKYMEDEIDGELRDYKFYCFGGKPYALLLATGRQSLDNDLRFDYFDMNFEHLNLTNHWHPNAENVPHMPSQFKLMKILAAKLSEGIPEVRVDFYDVNGKIYWGELTLFDMAGFLKIHPDD